MTKATKSSIVNVQLSGGATLTFQGYTNGSISQGDGSSASAELARFANAAKDAFQVLSKNLAISLDAISRIDGIIGISNPGEVPESLKMLKQETQEKVQKMTAGQDILTQDLETLENVQVRAEAFDNGVGVESEEIAQESHQDILERLMGSKTRLNTPQGKVEFIAALPSIMDALKKRFAEEGEKQFGSAPMAAAAKCPGCSGCQEEAPAGLLKTGSLKISDKDQEYLQLALKAGVHNGSIELINGYAALPVTRGQDPNKVIRDLIESEKAKEAQAKAEPKVSGSAMEDFLNDLFSGNLQFSEAPTLDGMIARRFQAKDNGIEPRHPESVIQALKLLGAEFPTEEAPEPKAPVRSIEEIGKDISDLLLGYFLTGGRKGPSLQPQ